MTCSIDTGVEVEAEEIPDLLEEAKENDLDAELASEVDRDDNTEAD